MVTKIVMENRRKGRKNMEYGENKEYRENKGHMEESLLATHIDKAIYQSILLPNKKKSQ